MSDWLRTALLIGMGAIALMLVIEWGEFQDAKRPQLSTDTTLSDSGTVPPAVQQPSEGQNAAMEIPQAPQSAQQNASPAATTRGQLVAVETDRLHVLIDTLGGDIVKVALPQHAAHLNSDEPLVLLNRNRSFTYVAQSGLVGANGTDLPNGERPVFSAAQAEYRLAEGSDSLQVDLKLERNGVNITKRFVFHRDSNLVDLNYLVDNQSGQPWTAHLYGQIKRDSYNPDSS